MPMGDVCVDGRKRDRRTMVDGTSHMCLLHFNTYILGYPATYHSNQQPPFFTPTLSYLDTPHDEHVQGK